MKQLVILAGGLGTRLKALLGDMPKPMIPIGGKPLLEIQVELARKHGFTDILIFACYRADLIEAHFGDGRRWGVTIRYVVEKEPLGTAGAVLAGFDQLADDFVVMYGDTMINVDLDRLWRTHLESGADATLLLHPNDHPLDSDLVEAAGDGWITAFYNRPHPADRWIQNLVNAGLYVIRKQSIMAWAPPPRHLDFGKDLFPDMLRQDRKLLAYNSPEYIKDIGTPHRYEKICAEFASGLVARSSFTTPQPAVFLDRDGTLNREVNGVLSPTQLELLPDAAEAVRELNHHGLRAVVVTNQPVIAKGFCSTADVEEVHRKLETELGREHAFLDRVYYCPHHPQSGFDGERRELKIECSCRKPKPGMLLQAARELNLDLANSWMIGDTAADVGAGRNAGVRTIMVRTGHFAGDLLSAEPPDFVFDTLVEAVKFIIRQPVQPTTSS